MLTTLLQNGDSLAGWALALPHRDIAFGAGTAPTPQKLINDLEQAQAKGRGVVLGARSRDPIYPLLFLCRASLTLAASQELLRSICPDPLGNGDALPAAGKALFTKALEHPWLDRINKTRPGTRQLLQTHMRTSPAYALLLRSLLNPAAIAKFEEAQGYDQLAGHAAFHPQSTFPVNQSQWKRYLQASANSFAPSLNYCDLPLIDKYLSHDPGGKAREEYLIGLKNDLPRNHFKTDSPLVGIALCHLLELFERELLIKEAVKLSQQLVEEAHNGQLAQRVAAGQPAIAPKCAELILTRMGRSEGALLSLESAIAQTIKDVNLRRHALALVLLSPTALANREKERGPEPWLKENVGGRIATAVRKSALTGIANSDWESFSELLVAVLTSFPGLVSAHAGGWLAHDISYRPHIAPLVGLAYGLISGDDAAGWLKGMQQERGTLAAELTTEFEGLRSLKTKPSLRRRAASLLPAVPRVADRAEELFEPTMKRVDPASVKRTALEPKMKWCEAAFGHSFNYDSRGATHTVDVLGWSSQIDSLELPLVQVIVHERGEEREEHWTIKKLSEKLQRQKPIDRPHHSP